jgi:hypothetical protein
MAKSNSFEFDPARVPEVLFDKEWSLGDETNKVYRVGDWSFEMAEDEKIQWAEEGIYAFIAWWQFLKENDATEA